MMNHFTPKVISRQTIPPTPPARCACGGVFASWLWTRARGSAEAWRPVWRCEKCGRVQKLEQGGEA